MKIVDWKNIVKSKTILLLANCLFLVSVLTMHTSNSFTNISPANWFRLTHSPVLYAPPKYFHVWYPRTYSPRHVGCSTHYIKDAEVEEARTAFHSILS